MNEVEIFKYEEKQVRTKTIILKEKIYGKYTIARKICRCKNCTN